jgi:2-oxoglutarate ferredoxin oxidoreductase subunit alpha
MRIAGESGEGVISAGDMFTLAAAHTGHNVLTFRTYPAEIKGGHNWYQVRVGNRQVLSMGDRLDVLVAFNAEAYHNHVGEMREGGVIIYDPDLVEPEPNGFVTYPIPLTKISRKDLDYLRGKNLVVLGALSGLFGLVPDSLENVIRTRLGRRAELLEKNLGALQAGYQYVREHVAKEDPFHLAGGTETDRRLVMSGNDALVAGALHAGCRYYAGYPITPASDIMEALAKELPKVGGMFLQAEDEIAAIASCVGASYGGVKALTATSGPGFSLMQELIGLAGMAEIPVVIVDAQRAGPSTGLPTKMEQSDLAFAINGGHGDSPRIVIAPGSVEDTFYQTVQAFNLAEKYQTPVILLTDQSLAHRTETMPRPDLARVPVVNRRKPGPEELESYARFAPSEDGVSPMAIPGIEGGMYVAPGLEHDEHAHPKYDPETHRRMSEKRFRKLERAALEPIDLPRYGAPDAEIGVVGWGSSEGAIREAVELANAEGYKVAAVHPRLLNPLQAEVGEFIESVRTVIVPEVNYRGQFANHLAATFGFKPVRLTKYEGIPLTPGEIYRKIQEVANGGRDATPNG